MEIKRVLRSKEFTRIETRELLRKDNKTTSITVTRPRLSKGRVAELLLSACLATGIAEFWVREIKGKPPSIKEILNTFTKLYKRIGQGLAARFLERDLKEIEEIVKQARENGWAGEETDLEELWELARKQEEREYKEDKKKELKKKQTKKEKSGDVKRNFFAHSGLLKDIIRVKKDGDNLILVYIKKKEKRNIIKEIKEWLKDPEKL